MRSSTLANDSNIDALHLQRRRASKMSTVAFYVLMPYGCSGLVKSFSSCTPRSNANTSALSGLLHFRFRYARLAADVSQQAVILRWYRGSRRWVAALTQPRQIGVRYKVRTRSALSNSGSAWFKRLRAWVRPVYLIPQEEKNNYIISIFLCWEMAAFAWHNDGSPCMTALEKCDKTKTAGDITQA